MIQIGKRQIDTGLFLFLIISVLLGIVTAVESSSLANRLYEDLDFTVLQRSALETPRELPGVFAVAVIGMLNSLGDIRIAAIANMIGGVGLILFGLAPNTYSLVLIFLVIYSTGQHLYLPLSNTVAMSFAKGDHFGQRLGQVQGLGSFSVICSAAVLFILYKLFEVPYSVVFSFAGAAMIAAGILFLVLDTKQEKIVSERAFVFKKEFKMYYILQTINGARKQITITFVPWLLIDIYGQPVTTITALFFVVCVINVFFKPWFGDLIDRRGEKFALRLEAVVMLIACIGFSFAKLLLPFRWALILAGGCYIIDKLMESASMARATLVKKLSSDPSDVARTLAMGQAMDHCVSMFIPLAAGYAWYAGGTNGYIYVFLGAIVISLANFWLAGKIR